MVWSGEVGALADGEGSWTWDGTQTDGTQAAAGDYTFTISGTDASGNAVEIDEHIAGIIDEMDYSTGTPLPSVSGATFEIGDILRLTTAAE